MEKLTRGLNAQAEFVLAGEEYKRPKPGAPSDLTEPWFRKKSFAITHEEPLTDALFSREIVDRLKAGYDFLIPYYRYFVTLEGDPVPEEMKK